MSDRELSYRDAAELAGMGYPFLHRIMTGKANPSIEVADKLADALS
jgi:transcriptional regulator with XRE-family HTH domain